MASERKTGFTLFCEDTRDALKRDEPGITPTQIMSILTERWSVLPREEREMYVKKSRELFESKNTGCLSRTILVCGKKIRINRHHGDDCALRSFDLRCPRCKKWTNVAHLYVCSTTCDWCDSQILNPAHSGFHTDDECFFGDFGYPGGYTHGDDSDDGGNNEDYDSDSEAEYSGENHERGE